MLDALLLAAAVNTGAIETAFAAPTLQGAHVGVLAVDAATGATLYEHHAGEDFVPASTFKLLTGSAALATLGPGFTYRTRIYGGAGNIYVVGGGDAQLTAADLDDAAATIAGKAASLSGSLFGDTSHYRAPRYPDGWTIDDMPNGYAAIPAALTLELGIAHVRVTGANAAGLPATLDVQPQTTAFTVENAVVTGAAGSPDTTDVERAWGQPSAVRIVGSYPAGAPQSDDLEPAVPDPTAYALDVLRQALAKHGMNLTPSTRSELAPPGAAALWWHESKPLSKILADCWGPSNNLLAEQMLQELGATVPNSNARASGAAIESQYLQSIGVDTASVTIADGSGLSSYDRITPRALVAILQNDWNGPNRQIVLDALPLAGVRGTLAKSFAGTPLAGHLYAKTGSMNHARALAGYLQTSSGATIAFAITIDEWMDASAGASKALDAARDQILEALLSAE